jgi:hypothetical protein
LQNANVSAAVHPYFLKYKSHWIRQWRTLYTTLRTLGFLPIVCGVAEEF